MLISNISEISSSNNSQPEGEIETTPSPYFASHDGVHRRVSDSLKLEKKYINEKDVIMQEPIEDEAQDGEKTQNPQPQEFSMINYTSDHKEMNIHSPNIKEASEAARTQTSEPSKPPKASGRPPKPV